MKVFSDAGGGKNLTEFPLYCAKTMLRSSDYDFTPEQVVATWPDMNDSERFFFNMELDGFKVVPHGNQDNLFGLK